MGATTDMKMVNGRVNSRSTAKAARILKEQGLTVSAFIRNSLEHIAHTGTVPECGLPATAQTAGRDRLRALMRELEARPMPGKRDYAGLGEDELVERLRMERHGY